MPKQEANPSDDAYWKHWRRQAAAEFVKALIHAHGGNEGDVRWFAMRAVAYADALMMELHADTRLADQERDAVKKGQLPLFTDADMKR